jgi:PPK2 family polyphosphate:nucleotide phosphotransferase
MTAHAHAVEPDGTVDITDLPTAPPRVDKKADKKRLADAVDEISDLQEVLYAGGAKALLLVFQGMDAAGKDSTIRKLLTGVNPAGVHVTSFKRPSSTERDHDFLWRTTAALPRRGMIGVFNRSHYEEVLVLRVHPEYLSSTLGRSRPFDDGVWSRRYAAIRAHEQHLADEGTVIRKFFLHVGRDEQKRRLLARIDEPRKNWKFELGDLAERALWPAYQDAFQDMLRETSRPWAPWYAIPADDKPYMRATIAEIVRDTLRGMDLSFPTVTDAERAALLDARRQLESD